MHHGDPVAFKGPGVFKVIDVMGKHQHRKVLQCPFIQDAPGLVFPSSVSVVPHVVFGGEVQLTCPTILHLA